MKPSQRCQSLQLIMADVDGVLTDGCVTYDNQGMESKSFSIRDGLGIKLWRKSGGKFAIITGRTSHVVQLRADELGIDAVRQGVEDKRKTAIEVMGELGVESDQAAYIGDDLPDIPAMQLVGLAAAPADAAEEVRNAAHHVTQSPGGHGAVRELVEFILQNQKRWEDVIQMYSSPGSQ
ncbi:MAG: HAD hydrolase family protein [Pirellulales bacterium]|nr:HAD hydrolase family protein [Pirellulales bacterium]